MRVARPTWLPAGTLRACPANCGALGRASVNSGAAIQRSPKTMPTLSIEESQNLKSAAPKKGKAKTSAPRRGKATSATVIAKKPPGSVVSKSKQAAAANFLALRERKGRQTQSPAWPNVTGCHVTLSGHEHEKSTKVIKLGSDEP